MLSWNVRWLSSASLLFIATLPAAGGLVTVLQTGDLVVLAPGDIRTVTSLNSGRLTDDLQLLVAAGFSDGSQALFVANLPEPGVLLLLLAAACWAARARSPRHEGRVRGRV